MASRKRFYVYLVYCVGSTYYVGKGQRYRVTSSLRFRKGLFYKIVYRTHEEAEAYRMERAVVRGMRKHGYRLQNLTAGGDGPCGFVCSPEQRERRVFAVNKMWEECFANPGKEQRMREQRSDWMTLYYKQRPLEARKLKAERIRKKLLERAPKLVFNGVEKPLIEWAQHFGIHKDTVRARLKRGWATAEALLTRPGEPKVGGISCE